MKYQSNTIKLYYVYYCIIYTIINIIKFCCSYVYWAVHQASDCNTDTTPAQPHRNSNTHRTKNNTANVVIQQNSRKLLMMGILMSETC